MLKRGLRRVCYGCPLMFSNQKHGIEGPNLAPQNCAVSSSRIQKAKDPKIPQQLNGFRSSQFNSCPGSRSRQVRFLVLEGCRHLPDLPLRCPQCTGNVTPSHSRLSHLCNDGVCLAAL